MSVGPLFVGFLRVGLFTYGGGQSMIPLMKEECVGAGLVSEEQFLEGLAVANALPGPITHKMALYIGWHDGGLLGVVAALAGLLLPSTVLMAALGGFILRNREHPWIAAGLEGLKPAIVGMLFFVAWDLAPAGVRTPTTAIVAVAAFIALVWKVHPAIVIALAMVAGVALFRG